MPKNQASRGNHPEWVTKGACSVLTVIRNYISLFNEVIDNALR